MEEVHRTHKEAGWGWFGALLALLDGFPRSRTRPQARRRAPGLVVTPWSHRSPGGWSA